MLNIQIDNPELEKSITESCGEDPQAIARAFAEFVQQRQIIQDVGVSIRQLEAGEGASLERVMEQLRAQYE